MRCSYCGKATHAAALCPHTPAGSSARARMRCTYCGARDHYVEACPKTYAGNAARAWHPDTVSDYFTED